MKKNDYICNHGYTVSDRGYCENRGFESYSRYTKQTYFLDGRWGFDNLMSDCVKLDLVYLTLIKQEFNRMDTIKNV